MTTPEIWSEITHEDDRYKYGKTYEGETLLTTFCIPKIGGKPPAAIRAEMREQTPEEWEATIKRGRRQYMAGMTIKQRREFIAKLEKNGYDLYGDTFEDLLNEAVDEG